MYGLQWATIEVPLEDFAGIVLRNVCVLSETPGTQVFPKTG